MTMAGRYRGKSPAPSPHSPPRQKKKKKERKMVQCYSILLAILFWIQKSVNFVFLQKNVQIYKFPSFFVSKNQILSKLVVW